MNGFLSRRLAAREDSGFTLIELTVAMFVTLIVMAALAGAFIGSISGIALTKQRQSATALATATMEQFRAIDYATVQSGMTCSDVVGDPRVTLSGSCAAGVTGTFAPGIDGINEPLVVQSSGAASAPLKPHLQSKQVENVTYSVGAYVSRTATTSQAYNLTVIVTWSSNVSKGTKTVIQRSVDFSPSRCLSSATHPYAGACQPSFNGDAGLTKAGVSLINADDGVSLIPGFDGTKIDLSLNALSATLGAEQLTTLNGLVTAMRSDSAGSLAGVSGGATANVSADTDPASLSSGVGTGTVNQSGVSTLTLSGTGGWLSSVPTTSDTGTLDARTTSSATSCLDATAAALNVLNQPCSWGAVRPSGTSAALRLALPNSAPDFTLARVDAATADTRSVVARVAAGGGTACPTASGPGCLTAQASRSVGAVRLGGLPTADDGDVAPTGWTGSLIKIDGLTESAYAEAGPGHRNPSFTRSAGTLRYYDAPTGTMKTMSDFTSLASDFTADLGTTTGTYYKGSHTTVIKLSGSMRVGAVTPLAPSVSIPDTTCKTSACSYSATPASTLTATLVYDITVDGVSTTRFALTVDLGAVLARASYKAAFDA